jgi:hypothetical protein
MNTTSGRLPAGISGPRLELDVTSREVVPGETARFPFTARTEPDTPSVQDFEVVADRQDFNPAWARLVQSTSGGAALPRYILEICPADVTRSQYGTYRLRLVWRRPATPTEAAGTRAEAEGLCTLLVKPRIRITAEPALQISPTGQVSLSLENCAGTDIEVSVTITHHGSSWSQGWSFELREADGPFEFSEQFDPPAGARPGEFELDISADGIPLIQMQVPDKHAGRRRKHVITAATAIAAAVLAAVAAIFATHTALRAQTISFSALAPGTVGGSEPLTAAGGGSGNPVRFSVDPASAPGVCAVSGPYGMTVNFDGAGTCIIDANQAGNAKYSAAPQVRQPIMVSNGSGGGGGTLQSQSISFSPPASGTVGGSANLAATGGGSGNPVQFSVDPASTPGACTTTGPNGSTVNFDGAGACIIDANQAGNASYAAAPQAQATITVNLQPQSITFSPPASGTVGESITLTAAGGGSGNPVTFSIDPATAPGVCTATGSNGSVITFAGATGTCIIDANQAGNTSYAAATQVQGLVTVTEPPLQ